VGPRGETRASCPAPCPPEAGVFTSRKPAVKFRGDGSDPVSDYPRPEDRYRRKERGSSETCSRPLRNPRNPTHPTTTKNVTIEIWMTVSYSLNQDGKLHHPDGRDGMEKK
jgi:hypothetical protein